MPLQKLLTHLDKQKDPERAANLARFFKTGAGQYGEGDKFVGLKVPELREAVKLYWQNLTLLDLKELLRSPYHEYRLAGLLVLVKKYEKGRPAEQKKIYDFYLAHLDRINNWDLVDLSAPNIVGDYLFTHPRKLLYKYVWSSNLWHRRIAVLSTFTFIREHDFTDSLKLAELLLADPHDLIHKAVGWMLREIGKRDLPTLISFLDAHATVMPRTMLRYAIEKLSPAARQNYLILKKH
ncbi:MAG: DNA alkylation repair protein [bacterium]